MTGWRLDGSGGGRFPDARAGIPRWLWFWRGGVRYRSAATGGQAARHCHFDHHLRRRTCRHVLLAPAGRRYRDAAVRRRGPTRGRRPSAADRRSGSTDWCRRRRRGVGSLESTPGHASRRSTSWRRGRRERRPCSCRIGPIRRCGDANDRSAPKDRRVGRGWRDRRGRAVLRVRRTTRRLGSLSALSGAACRPRRASRSRWAPRTRGSRRASLRRWLRAASASARSCRPSPR